MERWAAPAKNANAAGRGLVDRPGGRGGGGRRYGGGAAEPARVVITWGHNASGQLGRPARGGADGAAAAPQIVPALAAHTAERVACGAAFCVALVRHAHATTVWGWGSAAEGQLGPHGPR